MAAGLLWCQDQRKTTAVAPTCGNGESGGRYLLAVELPTRALQTRNCAQQLKLWLVQALRHRL